MTAEHTVKTPKKLIEVALPLDAINEASLREGYIYRANPSSLHKWWAQRPMAAARAVIFAQLVNDPSWKWEMEHSDQIPPNNLKASWAKSRKRLFGIIQELVTWENTTNEEVLEKARSEIRKSWRETCELNKDHSQAASLFNPDKLPPMCDPFAGGGTIPMEAMRLGFDVCASDLNPVAVLITKAMVEIPPKFAGKPPINLDWQNTSSSEKNLRQWRGAQGLADDVAYYGRWLRQEAQARIGNLYPTIEVTAAMAKDRTDLVPLVGQRLTVIAWLWARTVRSPNPAFRHVHVPLASTFILSSKKGGGAYVDAIVHGDEYRFLVKVGTPPPEVKHGTKSGTGGKTFSCLLSKAPMEFAYLRDEAKSGRMGRKLMAIVVQSPKGRVYLSPTADQEMADVAAQPTWRPDVEFFPQALGFRIGNYGMSKWSDVFTPRQLVALTTLTDLVATAREKIRGDALDSGMSNDERGLDSDGLGATAYSDAVSTYLAFAVSKHAMYCNSLVPWYTAEDRTSMLFTQQVVSMTWDFAEVNPFSEVGGAFAKSCIIVSDAMQGLPHTLSKAVVKQQSATAGCGEDRVFVSTDPPYYSNIGYADLSDFFYVWLRRVLRPVFPELFSTITVPKTEELVATPHRHGGDDQAEEFFLNGMTDVMHTIATQAHPAAPITIYYAYKQSETKDASRTTSAGWVTFLEAVVRAGLALSGTWPMRTERKGRKRESGSNALASSIILVCRSRPLTASTVSRRAFQRELNRVLPEALDEMTKGAGDTRSPVAPVDLSQAIIGPGMAVFSKYAGVIEADGTPMSVRTALQLINRFLAEDDFDHDTQFCLHWFEQYGWRDGRFGEADTLARAKGTSVDDVKQAGVLFAAAGVVRLLKWSEYPADWDPETDARLPVWEAVHQLIRVFKADGESGAGKVLGAIQDQGEAVRQLAYRLYTLCERAGWAEDARAYNEIVTSWSAIESAAAGAPKLKQGSLFA
jgi:putative DNA methylase